MDGLLRAMERMPLLATFATLFAAGALLLAGNGLLGTLIAVRANGEGFSATLIGLLGSAFYGGFIMGSLLAPRAILRVGHIRAFAVFAALFAASTLLHALVVEPLLWLAMRALGGVCFAGLTLVIESWLNERATNENRGRTLSTYRLIDLGAVTLGQFVLTLADPRGFELFSITALLFCLCLVPLSLTKTPGPAPITTPRLRLGHLIAVSPLGTAGVFAVGLVNGTFRMLAPLIAQQVGLSVAQIAAFMSAFILGGAVLQFPVGVLSDRVGRRPLLMLTSVCAIASGFAMSIAATMNATTLIAVTFVFGGCVVPIYSLAVAHANDFAEPDAFVEVSAGLFLIYGIGAMLGPFLGSAAVEAGGPHALFYYTSSVHLLLLVFAFYRSFRRPAAPRLLRRRFVALLRTSPGIFRLAQHDRKGAP